MFTDILAPVYDQCPQNITRHINTHVVTIQWDEPAFIDPHEKSRVRMVAQSYPRPEATFPWGEYVVQYVAIKENNALKNECVFSISIYRKYIDFFLSFIAFDEMVDVRKQSII